MSEQAKSDQAKDLANLKACYAEWHKSKGGSLNSWMEIMAEKIDFRSLAQGHETVPFTAPCISCSEVEGYLKGLVNDWEMIHYTVDEFIQDGDRIVAWGSTAWRNKNTGKKMETRKADLWRFENGKAIEYFEMYDTAAIFAAAT